VGTGNLEAVGMVRPLLAHMGGIDEIGVFLIPALLAIYAFKRADRAARKRAAAEAATAEATMVAADDGTDTEPLPPT
jgi:hypothetical protein